MPSYSLSQWLQQHQKDARLQQFIDCDLSKAKRLKQLHEDIGLPIEHKLPFAVDAILSNDSAVQEFFATHVGKTFSIKAQPKAEHTELFRQRKHGVTEQDCIEFVSTLTPTPHHYEVSMWPYFITDYAGNLVVTNKGVIFELVQGPHHQLTQGGGTKPLLGYFSFYTNQLHLPRHRSIALAALSFLQGNSSFPTAHGLVKGYFEFLYSKAQGFMFIDFNDSEFMTNIEQMEELVVRKVKNTISQS